MSLLGAAARTLVAAPLAELTDSALRRVLTISALWLGALGLLLLAIGFAGAAIYIALAAKLSSVVAALIVAGGLAVVSLGIAFAAWRATQRHHRTAETPRASAGARQDDPLQVALTLGMRVGDNLFGRAGPRH